MLTAEAKTINSEYSPEALSFSSELKEEIKTRTTFRTNGKKKVSRFTYTVGPYNFLLEQDIKVENLSNLTFNEIPRAPKWCKGIVNVRGIITPIVDMHDFLKTGSKTSTKKSHLMMLDHKDHSPVIFLIDQLPEIVDLDDYTTIEKPNKAPSWLIKAIKNGTNTLYQIDHSELMNQLKNTQ